MPKLTILTNHHMHADKGSRLVEQPGEEPVLLEMWTLLFTDRVTQDQVQISFPREARDELVKLLTGGVVLAGGGFPSGGPHLADGSLGFGPKAS